MKKIIVSILIFSSALCCHGAEEERKVRDDKKITPFPSAAGSGLIPNRNKPESPSSGFVVPSPPAVSRADRCIARENETTRSLFRNFNGEMVDEQRSLTPEELVKIRAKSKAPFQDRTDLRDITRDPHPKSAKLAVIPAEEPE